MEEVIIAIGLVFVIEGLLYALFPKAMKNMISVVLTQSENSIRTTGLCALLIGVVIIYLIK
ncbi:MAG: DUF2065 domain-containing protein [Kordiimonadaceae bacterium]|jgi:uncharacterized protein|nr:DUF2065 domain-containing protein [Kordiimonadaceae bacterium]